MANGFLHNPFRSPQPVLPEELTRTREWLHELFQEAGRGLPWPYQLALSLVEQGLVMGMFGGLLASAWLLQEARARSGSGGLAPGPELAPILAALEQAAIVPLPEQVQAALRLLGQAPGGPNAFEETIAVLIKPFFPGQESPPWEAFGRSGSRR
jgi:hypothetical protein